MAYNVRGRSLVTVIVETDVADRRIRTIGAVLVGEVLGSSTTAENVDREHEQHRRRNEQARLGSVGQFPPNRKCQPAWRAGTARSAEGSYRVCRSRSGHSVEGGPRCAKHRRPVHDELDLPSSLKLFFANH